MVNNDQPLEIAIIGAGIVGVIVALGMLERGIHVKIYEQGSSLREIGAGVAFTANAVQCMGKVNPNIIKCLRAVATANGDEDEPNDWLRYVDGYNCNSEDPRDEKLIFKLYAGYKGFEGCHRAHFLMELAKYIPEGTIQFHKRLDTIRQGEGNKVELNFSDGTIAHADAVIGCDGIKSRVRQLLLGESNPASYPCYTHRVCYRGLIPIDKAISAIGNFKALNQHMHVGPRAHMVHFPVVGQTLVNVAAFAVDSNEWPLEDGMVKSATREEVEAAFSTFGPTCRDITSLLPEKLDKWAIFDTYEHQIPFYNTGRVCIAGDAAHAAAPHHGAGAGIGVEDSLCLATLMENVLDVVSQGALSKAEALTVAFETFTSIRKERCHWLVDSSHNICDVYEWQHPEIGSDGEKLFKEIEWRSHKIWNFDIDGMLKQTREEFKNRAMKDKQI